MQALSSAKAGETYTIKWLTSNSAVSKLFERIELKEGASIKLVQKFYGDIIVIYRDRIYAISDEAASRIKV